MYSIFKLLFRKIANIRAQISSPCDARFPQSVPLRSFDHFNPLSLFSLGDLLSALKPSGSPIDPVPLQLIKEVSFVTGPPLLKIINCSLATSGVIPCILTYSGRTSIE